MSNEVCCTLCTCQTLAGVVAAAGVDELVASSTLSAELLLPLLSSPDPALLNELTPLSDPLSP